MLVCSIPITSGGVVFCFLGWFSVSLTYIEATCDNVASPVKREARDTLCIRCAVVDVIIHMQGFKIVQVNRVRNVNFLQVQGILGGN